MEADLVPVELAQELAEVDQDRVEVDLELVELAQELSQEVAVDPAQRAQGTKPAELAVE